MSPLKEQRKPTGQFWRADEQCLKIWSHNGPNCNMDLSTAEHFIRHQLSWLLSPYMCRLIHSEIAVKPHVRSFAEELRNLALRVTAGIVCSNICFSWSYKCFQQANNLCTWGHVTNPHAVTSAVWIQLYLWQSIHSGRATAAWNLLVASPGQVLWNCKGQRAQHCWGRDFWNYNKMLPQWDKQVLGYVASSSSTG